MMSRATAYATALLDAWEAGQENPDMLIDRLFDELRQNALLPLAPAILASLEQLATDRELLHGTAVTLSRKPGAHVQQKIDALHPTTVRIEPELIGGVHIRQQTTIIDGSLRGQLQQIRHALSRE